ncbi:MULTISPECIES: cytidine deaminase [Chloracidobacterium]|uniref:Cytidine deaminase n=1 Tax=Chloracidobacterium thermophilum (strain B) TaxID=981222 RepID=G2LFE4_CHLTF|nr:MULTISPECIES: cytidine deaminase [Chloracidobacterium]AEP10877.1 cytidine deaminase [Chloracidobacterium thermophilum B]QUV78807.1 cytidine deaminase [Chloracidobacterium thermophilum]QUV81854.1 cytidine deaminase [Chloracidobacterium sp. D]
MSRSTPSAGCDEAVLIAAAREARRQAHAPYSGFSVGAVVQARSGKLYTGCNIENASFGLTVCAERVALFKALSEGERQFQAVVIATDATTPTPPCGACRQVLWEFCGDIRIISAGPQGKTAEWSLAALLPAAFDDRNLAATTPSSPEPD